MTVYTREFPARWAESQEGLIEQMDGSPKGDLYSAKIGFDTEMLLAKLPTMHEKITRLPYEWSFAEKNPSNATPLAFNISNIPTSPNHQSILETMDGNKITVLVLKSTEVSLPIRDTSADHLWYVYKGKRGGICYTDLGVISYTQGDFIYIPKHITSYFDPGLNDDNTILIGIQCAKELRLPIKSPYQNMGTPFREYDMRLPSPYEKHTLPNVREIYVWRENTCSRIEYPYTQFLCVAWYGTLYPFAIHESKLRFAYPTAIHADPSNFTILASPDGSTVVSVLGPRFSHSLPYNHLNKWDEFLFYAKKYGAREGSADNVGSAGTATLHPQGIYHGPQITAIESWKKPPSPTDIPYLDDFAIMFETRAPLELCKIGQEIIIPDYEYSWLRGFEQSKQM